MYERESECVRVRKRKYVYVCVCERERERWTCIWPCVDNRLCTVTTHTQISPTGRLQIELTCVCVSVCVCVCECGLCVCAGERGKCVRERVCERVSESARVYVRGERESKG